MAAGFRAGAEHPVIGLIASRAALADDAGLHRAGHGSGASDGGGSGGTPADTERRIRGGVTEQRGTLDEAFADWDAREGLLAARFIDFLRRHGRR